MFTFFIKNLKEILFIWALCMYMYAYMCASASVYKRGLSDPFEL